MCPPDDRHFAEVAGGRHLDEAWLHAGAHPGAAPCASEEQVEEAPVAEGRRRQVLPLARRVGRQQRLKEIHCWQDAAGLCRVKGSLCICEITAPADSFIYTCKICSFKILSSLLHFMFIFFFCERRRVRHICFMCYIFVEFDVYFLVHISIERSRGITILQIQMLYLQLIIKRYYLKKIPSQQCCCEKLIHTTPR